MPTRLSLSNVLPPVGPSDSLTIYRPLPGPVKQRNSQPVSRCYWWTASFLEDEPSVF